MGAVDFKCSSLHLQTLLATLLIIGPIVEALLGRLYKNDKVPAGSIIGLVWFFMAFLGLIVWQFFIKPKERKDE